MGTGKIMADGTFPTLKRFHLIYYPGNGAHTVFRIIISFFSGRASGCFLRCEYTVHGGGTSEVQKVIVVGIR